jgi:hypothetical protein
MATAPKNMIGEVEVKGKKPIKKLDRVLAPAKKDSTIIPVVAKESVYKEPMVRVRSLKDLRNAYGDFSNDRKIRIEIKQAQEGKKVMPKRFLD